MAYIGIGVCTALVIVAVCFGFLIAKLNTSNGCDATFEAGIKGFKFNIKTSKNEENNGVGSAAFDGKE